MAEVKKTVRRGGRQLAGAIAPTVTDSVSQVPRLQKSVRGLRREVEQLRRRVAELETEVQENRRLNMRLAELTDVVQELLLPVGQRDEDALAARLENYSQGL